MLCRQQLQRFSCAANTVAYFLVLAIITAHVLYRHIAAPNISGGNIDQLDFWFEGPQEADDQPHHHPHFIISVRVILGLIGTFLVSALCYGGGIAGAGLFVPVFSVTVGFGLKAATGLSQASIAGVSAASLAFNFFRTHPWDPSKPLLDFDLALLLTPTLLLGASVGVLLNDLLPCWLITCVLVMLLVVTCYSKAVKGLMLWHEESQQQAAIQAAAAICSRPMPELRPICTVPIPTPAQSPAKNAGVPQLRLPSFQALSFKQQQQLQQQPPGTPRPSQEPAALAATAATTAAALILPQGEQLLADVQIDAQAQQDMLLDSSDEESRAGSGFLTDMQGTADGAAAAAPQGEQLLKEAGYEGSREQVFGHWWQEQQQQQVQGTAVLQVPEQQRQQLWHPQTWPRQEQSACVQGQSWDMMQQQWQQQQQVAQQQCEQAHLLRQQQHWQQLLQPEQFAAIASSSGCGSSSSKHQALLLLPSSDVEGISPQETRSVTRQHSSSSTEYSFPGAFTTLIPPVMPPATLLSPTAAAATLAAAAAAAGGAAAGVYYGGHVIRFTAFPWIKFVSLCLLWFGYLGLTALDAIIPPCTWYYAIYKLLFLLLTVIVTFVFIKIILIDPLLTRTKRFAGKRSNSHSAVKHGVFSDDAAAAAAAAQSGKSSGSTSSSSRHGNPWAQPITFGRGLLGRLFKNRLRSKRFRKESCTTAAAADAADAEQALLTSSSFTETDAPEIAAAAQPREAATAQPSQARMSLYRQAMLQAAICNNEPHPAAAGPPSLVRVAAGATAITGAAGMVSGVCGVAGAAMITPLLLDFRVHPQVAAATSILLVFLSSTTATLSFMMEGRLLGSFALLYAAVSVVGVCFGVWIVGVVIRRMRRTSLLLMMLAGLMGLGGVSAAVYGVMNFVADVAEGEGLGFRVVCSYT